MPELLELIREMRAGLEGVTPGPWETTGSSVTDFGREWPGSLSMEFIPNGCDDGVNERHKADAAHIARCSPENIAKLLDAAEAALQQMTWPDACSLTVKDGVVQAAYNTDEEAEEVFRLLAPTPPHIGSSGQTGDGRP